MTKQEQRQIAIQAARGKMRRMDITPETQTADQALTVLDDLIRKDPELICAQWYARATGNQIKLFIREWRQWRAEQVGLHAVVKEIEDALPVLEFEIHGKELYSLSDDCGLMDDPGEYFEKWFYALEDVPDGTTFTLTGKLPSTSFAIFPKLEGD